MVMKPSEQSSEHVPRAFSVKTARVVIKFFRLSLQDSSLPRAIPATYCTPRSGPSISEEPTRTSIEPYLFIDDSSDAVACDLSFPYQASVTSASLCGVQIIDHDNAFNSSWAQIVRSSDCDSTKSIEITDSFTCRRGEVAHDPERFSSGYLLPSTR